MDLTRGVSIVIPLRVDNPERAENLRFILSLLLQQTEVSVDILEADTEQRFIGLRRVRGYAIGL
ncbi:hypothetical protein M076_4401 [Bacteroides fragilis str. 2-F-2 |uniref:Uncharacterized protein n=1 Tax=Bacteroides fragilis str. 2-F-2 \|nr:hypothetical protein M077_4559 [Bacteroides fragilis str. 2-F-2 \